jgi:hypothetical protein
VLAFDIWRRPPVRPGGLAQCQGGPASPMLLLLLAMYGSGRAALAGGTATPLGYELMALDRWHWPRGHARAVMTSTYDRDGGNDGADASNFVYMLRDPATGRNRSVVFDVRGAGAMVFARFQHWHGSPWVLEVDDQPAIVFNESNTATQSGSIEHSVFHPRAAFPNGSLSQTFAATKGGDILWTPITFSKSLRLSYENTHYGSGYEILQLLPTLSGSDTSPWSVAQVPPSPVVAMLEAAGSGDVASLLPPLQHVQGGASLQGCALGHKYCKRGVELVNIHGGCSPTAFCRSTSAPSSPQPDTPLQLSAYYLSTTQRPWSVQPDSLLWFDGTL